MRKMIFIALALTLLLSACGISNPPQSGSAVTSTSSEINLDDLPEPAEGTNLIVINPGESWGEFGPGEYIFISIFELDKHMLINTFWMEQLEKYGVRPELVQQILDNDYDYTLRKQAEKELIEAGLPVPTMLVLAEDYPDFVVKNTSEP